MNSCAQYAIPLIEGNVEFDDILRLLTNVNRESLIPIITKFVSGVRVFNTQGEPVELAPATLDQEFSGSLIDIALIFQASCELQYKDFFVQGRALLPAKK